MKEHTREPHFTKDALSKTEIDKDTGHLNVFTDKGIHVLTIVHPLQKDLNGTLDEEEMLRFNSDTLLHVHAVSLYDTLEVMVNALEMLKSGAITIFNFPINALLQQSNNVLDRVTDKAIKKD